MTEAGFTSGDGMRLFPYSEPRSAQKKAMDTIHDCASNGGFTLMEGACGTGKTLASLVPLIEDVLASESEMDTIVAVTSVKQQMEAFQAEVERINETLDEERVNAIAAVGVSDLHPLLVSGEVRSTTTIQDLRDNTRELVYEQDVDASELTNAAEVGSADWEYPYQKSIPRHNGVRYDPFYAGYLDVKPADSDGSWDVPFSFSDCGILRTSDLLSRVGGYGVCPHSFMRESLSKFDVVIGNYYHVFEERTRELILGDVVSPSSYIILDEGHNTVSRVRDLLGKEMSIRTVKQALWELREVIQLLKIGDRETVEALKRVRSGRSPKEVWDGKYGVDDPRALVNQYENLNQTISNAVYNDKFESNAGRIIELGKTVSREMAVNHDFGVEKLEEISELVDEFRLATNKLVVDEMESEYGNRWEKELSNDIENEKSIPLRDPDEIEQDRLSVWLDMKERGDDEGLFETLAAVAKTIAETKAFLYNQSDLDIDIDTPALSLASFIKSWRDFDNIRYFRTIQIEEWDEDASAYDPSFGWEDSYSMSYEIKNCIPRQEIAEQLQKFGGGVLMSATLEPMDVFKQVTGVDLLESEHNRTVVEETFGLAFPEENRKTIGVDIEPFTYENKKGSPIDRRGNLNMDGVRQDYADIVLDTVRQTDGCTLVCMPSYSEAEWIGRVIRQNSSLRRSQVLIDESSANHETTRLKQDFFDLDNGVLCTAAHGTLIEGVDYEGDKLHSAVVVGVPIENTQGNFQKATRTAYDEVFGSSNGFEFAFTVPAVRKARQAIGRVIRQTEDTGIRVFADSRYATTNDWNSVKQYLSDEEKREMEVCDISTYQRSISEFWEKVN